jgi:hypothetical protein
MQRRSSGHEEQQRRVEALLRPTFGVQLLLASRRWPQACASPKPAAAPRRRVHFE